MSTLTKLLLVPAAVLLAVAGVALAGGTPSAFEAETSGTVSTDATSTETLGAETGSRVDVSGPCDEAEHVNDPRCAGVVLPGPAAGTAAGGVDISGPCDELEHVNDPRCTGAGRAADDNSGPGSASSGRDRDDHRGRGRGRGRGGDRD